MKLQMLLGAATALAVAGCAGPMTGRAMSPIAPGARYVALGSSFAAGAAIGPLQPGSPERCGRTVNNYASLLAERLHLDLEDRSCGGATTAHVLGPWNELPPQIDGVDASTRLITITIGGNDLNYVGNLFLGSCEQGRIYEMAGYKIPCTPPKAPTESDYRRVAASIRAIAEAVHARAPKARLVFVQYVSLVPDAPCAAAPLSGEYGEIDRAIGRRLAEATAAAAEATGAEVVPADQLSRGHDPCSAEPWSNGMIKDGDLSRGAPWHPNSAGHAAIARALAELVG